ncbi:Fructose-2,6-bisphosphatase [Mortierella sp. GBA30]|nr:Fructose-2,6-bisphosphatase [Mortierella sp. GBA30]
MSINPGQHDLSIDIATQLLTFSPRSRIACVLVGLPGTSKTLVAQKVCRYLQWLGISTKVFNVGNYRRKLFGAAQPHSFFDPANPAGERSRSEASQEALKEMIHWLRHEHGVVAIYDGTNNTRAKRELLLEECRKHDVEVMFIESVCEDEGLRLANAIETSQQSTPDYEHMQPELALQDFKQRVQHFEAQYETITERDLTYVKLIDAGSQVIVSQIQGYLQSRIVYYLMNLRIKPRTIYFSRHGESLYNVMGLLGGDSDLSARGKQYARALPRLVSTHVPNHERLTVWTSTKRRTIATAKHLPHKKLAWQALDELEAGKADGLTYNQVEELFPEDFAKRDDDKYNYRYQDGESYKDVVARLEAVIMDLERTDDILIIGHQAILRCLYAYFMNYSHERLPYIKIPLHTVIQLTPGPYACEEKRFKVDIEAVDTHRPKPKAGVAVGGGGVMDQAEGLASSEPTPAALEETTTPVAAEAVHGLHAAAEAAAEKPKIILSTLRTNTFRDSIHPTADSVSSWAQQTPSAPASVMAPVTVVNLPSPALEEKVMETTVMATGVSAIGSINNPAIGLGLNEVATAPILEQVVVGVKGPILGISIGSNNGSSSVLATTPPMSPVPSLPGSVASASPGRHSETEEESSTPIPGDVTNSKMFSPMSLSDQIVEEMGGYEGYECNNSNGTSVSNDSIDTLSLATAASCV